MIINYYPNIKQPNSDELREEVGQTYFRVKLYEVIETIGIEGLFEEFMQAMREQEKLWRASTK